MPLLRPADGVARGQPVIGEVVVGIVELGAGLLCFRALAGTVVRVPSCCGHLRQLLRQRSITRGVKLVHEATLEFVFG